MKSLIFVFIIGALTTSCNNSRPASNQQTSDDNQTGSVAEAINTGPLKEIIGSYIQLKNDLASDNTANAAEVGKVLAAVFRNFDKSDLTPDQKKTYEDVEADEIENSEHISESGGDIAHQREHFELLSNDVYELVKTFGSGQDLYRDFCPMYKNGKGAYWLSETKEIQNPYYGEEMPTCGVIKEELK
jgi:hypothetical protein